MGEHLCEKGSFMPKITKHLIKKFILDDCSPDEIQLLIAYFKGKGMDDAFPEVEEVLQQLNHQQGTLPKTDAQRIYRQILKKTAMPPASLPKKKKRKASLYLALAAMFVGIVGATVFFNAQPTQTISNPSVPSITISAQPDIGIQLVKQDGSVQNLSPQGQFNLTDKEGNLISTQKENTLVYSKEEKPIDKIVFNTLKVSYGNRFEVKLADGSHVILNAGSSLKYPVNFPEKGDREVFLSGEAFFDVTKDEKRPFKVHTDQFDIQVLGTQFNANSYEQETASVALVQGAVDLNKAGDPKKVVHLKPGQLAQLHPQNKEEFTIKAVDTDLYTAWIKGGLVFRNVTFQEMLKKMGRHYNITIINNNEEMGKARFNASFGNEPLQTLLRYYKEVYGIQYTQQDNTIIIQPKTKDMKDK